MENIKVKVILGSTRNGRFGEKPAQWILDEVKKQPGVEAELLDLKDYPLDFFKEPMLPAMTPRPYPDPKIEAWAKKIEDGDAFIIVTPEYNFGPPAVLKNALDSIYKEWNRKPVGFVSYGGVGGARAIQQLRQTLPQLQMVSTATSVHMLGDARTAVEKAPAPVPQELWQPFDGPKTRMFAELLWWAKTLKAGRMQVA